MSLKMIAECERCDAQEDALKSELPIGWARFNFYTQTGPGTSETSLTGTLCPACVKLAAGWLSSDDVAPLDVVERSSVAPESEVPCPACVGTVYTPSRWSGDNCNCDTCGGARHGS